MRLVMIIRPIFWPLYPILFIIGLNAAGGKLSIIGWPIILQIIALTFPAALLTYGINDAFDRKTDARNPRKKNLVEGTAISQIDAEEIKKLAPFAIMLLVISSLLTANLENILLMALFSLAMYFYSAPPIRLKERPPLDSLINGFFYFLAPFALGFSLCAPIYSISSQLVLLLFTCAAGLHALAAVTDYEPDKKVKNNTVAVWLGQRGASLFALVLFAINLFFIWPLGIYLMLIIFTAGALTDLLAPRYAKQSMIITIMWGVVTTLTYFVERILL